MAEASFEARQFHSGVRPRPRQSSISATLASIARACRLKGIVVSISSEAYFALKVNSYAALVISLPTTVQKPKKSRAIHASHSLVISAPSCPR
ncbi:MAG: hypothetical protein QGI49_12050, partial [SAR202 cluster bacterium]|nr:hypothetical protein [SAR202 cluster bacterium]